MVARMHTGLVRLRAACSRRLLKIVVALAVLAVTGTFTGPAQAHKLSLKHAREWATWEAWDSYYNDPTAENYGYHWCQRRTKHRVLCSIWIAGHVIDDAYRRWWYGCSLNMTVKFRGPYTSRTARSFGRAWTCETEFVSGPPPPTTGAEPWRWNGTTCPTCVAPLAGWPTIITPVS
jgi:hypothetical protein